VGKNVTLLTVPGRGGDYSHRGPINTGMGLDWADIGACANNSPLSKLIHLLMLQYIVAHTVFIIVNKKLHVCCVHKK
jgi:hypothetical protein